MPKSIKIVLASLTLFFILNLATDIYLLVNNQPKSIEFIPLLILVVLLFSGLFFKNKLFWQWGRIYAGLIGVFSLLHIITALLNGKINIFLFVMIAYAACLISICIFLGKDDSRKYFGLVCLNCNSLNVKANNFLFTKTKCINCGNIG